MCRVGQILVEVFVKLKEKKKKYFYGMVVGSR